MTKDNMQDLEIVYLRDYLYRSFATYSRGYNLKELLIEATGERAMHEAVRAGFHLLNDYSTYYQHHPPLPPADVRPYLLHLNREAAVASEGCFVSYTFAYTPPRCFFTEREQELLSLAVAGTEDEEIAAIIDRTIWTIQKRWQQIFERVSNTLPGLLPPQAHPERRTGKRGVEKRTVVIRYLQEHPEELRPVHQPEPGQK